MGTGMDLDSSPCSLLRSVRGPVVSAQIAYPDVLHVEIRDPKGKLWLFATQDAEWRPKDPGELLGRSVEDAEIDPETCELRFRLSGGSVLEVEPSPPQAEDDPPSWELISPDGTLLEFGSGLRWRISDADDPLRC